MREPEPLGETLMSGCLAGVACAIGGAVLAPVLQVARDAVFFPSLLRDGQYILGPAMVIPQGLWIGGGIGLACVFSACARKRAAVTLLALFIAALAAVPAAMIIRQPGASFYDCAEFVWYASGVPLICGVIGLTALAARTANRPGRILPEHACRQ